MDNKVRSKRWEKEEGYWIPEIELLIDILKTLEEIRDKENKGCSCK